MAVDKLVDSTQLDADLTIVADAIRAKSGGNNQLAFPSGFVSEIGNIPSGGTLITKTITENGTYDAEDDNADGYSSVTVEVAGSGGYTANDWLDLSKPAGKIVSDATTIYANALRGRINITEIVLTAATDIPDSFARDCTGLTKVSLLPTVTDIRSSAFYGTTNLRGSIYVPNTVLTSFCFQNSRISAIVCKGVISSQSRALSSNPELIAVDFVDATHVGYVSFEQCTAFNVLICRGQNVATLPNLQPFNNTPFASGKSGGTLYVPQALISSYEAATNWSTILGYTNNQILPIEGSIYETQYADGTPIS